MKNKSGSILLLLLLSATPLWAQPKPSELESFFNNPLLIILGGIALILLFVIYVMAKVALMTIKKGAKSLGKSSSKTVGAIGTIVLMLSSSSFALGSEAEGPSGLTASITSEALWASLGVIGLEVLIIIYLYGIIRRFSGMKAASKSAERWAKIWSSFQTMTPIEDEGDIDTGHNYDGIRELDNPIPPWWRWAFFATILFAPIYLYRYHIAHSAPLQLEELAIEIEEGEARKKEYLANSPNAIDENNIATMEGIQASAGAGIFAKNCVACHGASGEGNAVGPNLTDAAWLHGGGLTNIFKSVKYGWPEKGMKSWQAEMSSLEMAQVATYVASLQGSNPPNAKEAQGDIWKDGDLGEGMQEATEGAEDAATLEEEDTENTGDTASD